MFRFNFLGSVVIKLCFVAKSQLSLVDNSHIPKTLSQVFSITTESCEINKHKKDCLWKQRTHYRLENGSLDFTETLHKQSLQ